MAPVQIGARLVRSTLIKIQGDSEFTTLEALVSVQAECVFMFQ